jgi:hypothetical protein
VADVARLHAVNRAHLDALTGELGIFQHANGAVPDPEHGYCVDDVARALEVDLLHASNLRFLEDAIEPETGRLRNFRAADGTWLGDPGAGDTLGRTFLALGLVVEAAPDRAFVDRAVVLLDRLLPQALRVAATRPQASIILGCAAIARASVDQEPGSPQRILGAQAIEAMRRLATGLHAKFLWAAGPGWHWLEPTLTYENAVIPRALIVAGRQLKANAMLAIGLQVIDWLITIQTAPEGHLTPIGNGWWPRAGERSVFDQQPIEAASLLLAAEAAFEATGEPGYAAAMERAYGWFLGRNDGKRRIASPARGACHDGLTRAGVNANQGAESTLMWLMALEHIRAARGRAKATRAALLAVQPAPHVQTPRQRTQRAMPEGRFEFAPNGQ